MLIGVDATAGWQCCIIALLHINRLIESLMVLRPRQGNLRLVFRLFSFMRGLPNISLIVVVVVLFYVHGKHPRSCRDGQLT